MQSKTIAIDLAKSVFQLAISEGCGRRCEQRRLTRSQFQRFIVLTPPARLVMESCAGAHHWARLAQAQGHQVKLLHPAYVRPYVRRNKTDAADAQALLKADADTELHPVPVKSVYQQSLQSLHRIREQWQRTRTARINEARGLLGEFGLVLPKGAGRIGARLHACIEQLPELLQPSFAAVVAEIGEYTDKIKQLDRTLAHAVEQDLVGQRLIAIPGVGSTIASAALARVGDMHTFTRARAFASWLGLTPREYSSGNQRTLGRISRRGDCYLRMLLIHGARSALLAAQRRYKGGGELSELQRRALQLNARVGHNKATVALANKMARILWAVWTKDTGFDGNHARRYRGNV